MMKSLHWGLLLAGAAFAASPACADAVEPAANAEAVPADAGASDLLTDDELGKLRGGESLIVSNQTLVAITSGNVLNGDYTAGSVSLSDFALSNFNGIGNLTINTGGQVSVQTGMNLTINVGN